MGLLLAMPWMDARPVPGNIFAEKRGIRALGQPGW
jgi:hypothetical protein